MIRVPTHCAPDARIIYILTRAIDRSIEQAETYTYTTHAPPPPPRFFPDTVQIYMCPGREYKTKIYMFHMFQVSNKPRVPPLRKDCLIEGKFSDFDRLFEAAVPADCRVQIACMQMTKSSRLAYAISSHEAVRGALALGFSDELGILQRIVLAIAVSFHSRN